MPRYMVEWNADVDREFTELWLRSDSELRDQLNKACHITDRDLSQDPDRLGAAIPDEPGIRCWILPGISTRVGVCF